MNENVFKAIRLRKNMSQREFAELLGISESTVAAIESKRRPISDQVRARLAQKIEVDEGCISFLESLKKLGNIIPK